MSDTTRSRLKVSREGIVLIKSFEGFRPRAVQDEAGGWVIGYGHTASAREGAAVGEQDAELLLQYDLMPVAKALNEDVSVPLNQHQFDALASFAVSVGVARFLASDVLRRLNEGHAGEAADALIGWPEPAAPDTALRRRAAERALFVADPASPVLLADLLAAPLPPPPVAVAPEPVQAAETPVVQPDFAAAGAARAAAVASLLGETPASAEDAPAEPAVAVVAPAAASAAPPATFIPSVSMRYSPYGAAIIGPLPGFPLAGPGPAPAPAPAVEETAPPAEADGEEAAAASPETPVAEAPAGPVGEPLDLGPLVPPPAAPSPFPPMDELVLTPPVEADFIETARPVWPPEQRLEPAEDGTEEALFTDEPPLSVLRHEVEPEQPRRFDWSETGAFLIMGGVGLAACAASAAAFRLAVTEPSDMGETAVIAWALALIGAICVGVSSWNLYVRWGRSS